MKRIRIIEVEEVASTNTMMAGQLDALDHGTVIAARRQTAGRGQRGNSWESEDYKNVTMSLLLRDLPVAPRRQFAVSEAVALSVADTVAGLLGNGDDVSVKWPNDIYVGNRKIAGILIECGIMGNTLTQAIAGIGLNVNQTVFRSDAPNPVSVAQLTGRTDYATMSVTAEIAGRIVDLLDGDIDTEALHSRYLSKLWRREGLHLWRRKIDGLVFRASIADVTPEGFLYLLPEGADETMPPFAFKEVEALPE